MSKIATIHGGPLDFFLIFWAFSHVVLAAAILEWPPTDLVNWVIFWMCGGIALFFDMGLLYLYLTDKTEANPLIE